MNKYKENPFYLSVEQVRWINMKKRYIVMILMLTMLVLGLMGCGTSNSYESNDTSVNENADNESADNETTAGNVQTITIVHVNDIHGYVEETDTAIGYPKIAALFDKIKADNPNTIALDAGDTFGGSPSVSFDQAESAAAVLSTIAFDAMVLGNHDLFLELNQIFKITDVLDYPVLAGNVSAADGGEDPFKAYTIISMENGLKVGIVTATNGVEDEIVLTDPVESLQAQVDEIKSQVDITIALTHLGIEESSGNTSQLIAEEVEGIEVIIDGHSHTVLEEGMVVGGILIAQTGEYSNNIGVVELTVVDGKLDSASARLITKKEMTDAEEKEDTAVVLEELVKEREVYLNQVVGETTVDLMGTRDIIRTQETSLGNLYTDVMRELTGADTAIAIAGTIGGEISAGKITKNDILSISRVNVPYLAVELTGADILETLNSKIKKYPESSGTFLQISGMTIKIDPDQEAGSKVHSVTINGEALKLEKTYTIAVPHDTVSNAGLVNGTVISDVYESSEVVLEKYITANSPISPQIEGRIIEEAKVAE